MNVHVLALMIYAAMTQWVPLHHHIHESPDVTVARYRAIASDIASVALDPDEKPAMGGERARERTALLLASIASLESFYRADVDSCRRTGDQGLAKSLFQVHGPRTKLCWDRQEAVRQALRWVRWSFSACRRLPLGDRLSGYAVGRCEPNEKSRHRVQRAVAWWREHPYSG